MTSSNVERLALGGGASVVVGAVDPSPGPAGGTAAPNGSPGEGRTVPGPAAGGAMTDAPAAAVAFAPLRRPRAFFGAASSGAITPSGEAGLSHWVWPVDPVTGQTQWDN